MDFGAQSKNNAKTSSRRGFRVLGVKGLRFIGFRQ